MVINDPYTEGGSPTLQFKFNQLLFEVLRESGRRYDRSPHLEAKKLLLEKMRDEKMLPNRNFQDLVTELLYGMGKKIIEDKLKPKEDGN